MTNSDWVIWISLVILFSAVALSVGSRYFPSQCALDAEYQAGHDDGWDARGDWDRRDGPTVPVDLSGAARFAERCEAADLWPGRGGMDPPPVPPAGPSGEWQATTAELAELGRAHYMPLAGVDSPPPVAMPRLGSFIRYPTGSGSSPIFDQLAAEFSAGALPPGAAARLRADWRTHNPDAVDQGAAPGPSALLAEPTDTGTFAVLTAGLMEAWAMEQDVARCGAIVREVRELGRTLGGS